MFDRHRLGPSRSPSLLVKKALVERLAKDLVVELGTIVMEDLQGANTPSPNLILRRTILPGVLITTELDLMVIAHLNFPLQHPINDLKA